MSEASTPSEPGRIRIGTGATTLKIHVFKQYWSNGYVRFCDYRRRHTYYHIANETSDLTEVDCAVCKRHPAVRQAQQKR